MSNNANNNKKNTQENGVFLRTVPIVLAAVAVFIAVCFVFGGTGAFGFGVSSVLLGLFSSGAYAIPLLLLLHALFFKEDHAKGKIVSRIVFSFIAMMIVSSIDYTVCYWGAEPSFDPALFYAEQTAGGFIGGIFSFCITKIIGAVGLIILDLTIVIAYAIVFFGRKDSTARRGVLGILEFFTSILAIIENKIKKNANDRREAKAEEKRQETERHHAEFLDDPFFSTDDMDELKINELGIHKSRDPKSAEKRPNLQSKVHIKSAVPEAELEKERAEREKKEKAEQKKPSFDFNVEPPKEEGKKASDLGHVFFEDPNVKFGEQHTSYGIDESASNVFTKDFDPFDFATGERLVAKQSTRSATAKKKTPETHDSTSLFSVTEQSIAENQRRKEFEQRKSDYFASRQQHHAPTPVSAVPPSHVSEDKHENATDTPAPEAVQPTEVPYSHRPVVTTMEFGSAAEDAEEGENNEDIKRIVEITVNNNPVRMTVETADEAVSRTIEKGELEQNAESEENEEPTPEEENLDAVAEEIAERVLMNNPAYARSANKCTYTTIVRNDTDESQEQPEDETSAEADATEADESRENESLSDTAGSVPLIIEDAVYASDSAENAEPEQEMPEPKASEISAPDVQESAADPATASHLAHSVPLFIEDVNYADIKKEETVSDTKISVSEEPAAFKPYTPPTVEPAPQPEPAQVLVTERELLTPVTEEAPDKFLEREIARYDLIEEDHETVTETAEKETFVQPTETPKNSVYENRATVAAERVVTDTAAPVAPVFEKAEVNVEKTFPAPAAAEMKPSPAPKAEQETVSAAAQAPVPNVSQPIFEATAPTATPIVDDALFSASVNSQTASPFIAEEEGGTVFTFDDDSVDSDESNGAEDDGDDDIFAPQNCEQPDEENAEEDMIPIPPEEQNPEVIKQRAMFPFLDEEEEPEQIENEITSQEPDSHTAEVSVNENEVKTEAEADEEEVVPFDGNNSEDGEEDDDPPFEIDAKDVKKEAALVPVEEKPKKKDYSNYVFPPIDLLHDVNEDHSNENIALEIQDNADKLIDTLASFGVTASIKGVDRGPRITRYEVVPARGIKVSSIMNLSDDIALNLAADGIRMEAPIPGKTAVGVEIPNKKSSLVRLRELIETDDYKNLKSKTTVCMGKDVAGQPVFADVAKMPHALVAGATGMGKSVWINSLMLSILYKARPDEVKFIMIDPKQVEFTMYNGIPHLLVPVVTDVKQAAGTLMWAVEEMERRYGVLQERCVRNIDAYNDKIAADPSLGEPMPRIIIVIDEFAELIMQAKNPVENLIIRIAQKARAAGIHLIIGTQKPVKEVITGLIKSNIPSKFSCKVASTRDSLLIFDSSGAEKLLDKGDMLVSFANSIKPLRVQSAFVADDEVEDVMEYLKQFSDGSNYDEDVMEEIKRAADKCSKKGGSDRDEGDDDDSSPGEGYLNDKQFLDAVEIAVNTGKISTSLIQRKLSIGYGKAAKFIDVMEDKGIVGEANGSKPREVLISADEWRERLARLSYD